jgi:hypothetical protein
MVHSVLRAEQRKLNPQATDDEENSEHVEENRYNARIIPYTFRLSNSEKEIEFYMSYL